MTKPYEEVVEQHGTGTKFVIRTFEDSLEEDELVCIEIENLVKSMFYREEVGSCNMMMNFL